MGRDRDYRLQRNTQDKNSFLTTGNVNKPADSSMTQHVIVAHREAVDINSTTQPMLDVGSFKLTSL